MGAPTASIASPPQNNGLTPVSNNGGKAGGSGKGGMSSFQPSNQTLTANTAQPAMGAPAAYSNTITPSATASSSIDPTQNPSSTQMGSGKNGIAGATPKTYTQSAKPISGVNQGIQEQMDTITGQLSNYGIPNVANLSQGKGN